MPQTPATPLACSQANCCINTERQGSAACEGTMPSVFSSSRRIVALISQTVSSRCCSHRAVSGERHVRTICSFKFAGLVLFICKVVLQTCTLLGVIISTRGGFSILLSRGTDIDRSPDSVSISVQACGCTANTSMSAFSTRGHFSAAAAALLTLLLRDRNMTLENTHSIVTPYPCVFFFPFTPHDFTSNFPFTQ